MFMFAMKLFFIGAYQWKWPFGRRLKNLKSAAKLFKLYVNYKSIHGLANYLVDPLTWLPRIVIHTWGVSFWEVAQCGEWCSLFIGKPCVFDSVAISFST